MLPPVPFYSEISILEVRSDQSSKDGVVGLAVCFLLVLLPASSSSLQGVPVLIKSSPQGGTYIRHLYLNVNESLCVGICQHSEPRVSFCIKR